MANGSVTLETIHEDILALRKEVEEVKVGLDGLRDIDLEVKPAYIDKLKKIEKGKFLSREELERELED
ncbi:hypothetical protein HY837_06625 [archaeon]|nr:hypothetical protein [archaeon]